MEKKLRPNVHFTPEKGWMNDPNAPVFFRGEYHLFYQHDPDSLVWDTMHWGHARSKDLMHWEHMPIALYPDDMGVIYSGSAFVDEENASGLGTKEEPALLLFYTSHNMETKREMQCLAYTTDGEHFQKYVGNPILPGKDNTPARDPQVFRNAILGGYSLCLTTEKAIEFYHSTDFRNWTKTGAFIVPDYGLSGMIECPCMFQARIDAETDADPAPYVLMMSMDVPETEFAKFPEGAVAHSRVMQYFVGTFDGSAFATNPAQKKVLLVDHGPDFYAGTIFSNVEETILIAWLGNFSEKALATPTEQEGFRGIQSFPRILTLRMTEDGWRLCQRFWTPEGKNIPVSSGCAGMENSDVEIIDGCVREVIRKDGLWSETSYL